MKVIHKYKTIDIRLHNSGERKSSIINVGMDENIQCVFVYDNSNNEGTRKREQRRYDNSSSWRNIKKILFGSI